MGVYVKRCQLPIYVAAERMFIINTNTVKHTPLPVVSITEIIEYYKNGYMSATVGTRLHLASG